MKINRIKVTLIAISIIAIYSIYSCSSSGQSEETSTTVAEDKQNITNTIESFYGCLNTLDDGDLSDFLLYSLFNNGNSAYNDTWLKSLTDKFEQQHGDIILNDKLQFANKAGIYSYNKNTQIWTKVNNSNVLTLQFPSKQSESINDAELSLNSYSDTSVTYNSNTFWLPNAANLTLKRNGTTLFALNLSNVTFQLGTNFSMPINADLTIFTAPFTHTFQWRRNTNTDFSLTYNSSTPQGCGTSFVTNVKLYDNDYGNIVSLSDDVKTINGNFSEGSLRVNYAINIEEIAAYTDPTDAQINAYFDAEVFYNNIKIGDLDYRTVNNKTEMFIIYSDGSSENINVYVSDFETKINDIFANYLN